MLQMFKAYYQQGTSILDDFDFYEEREKSLRSTRSNRSAMMLSIVDNSSMHLESSFGNISMLARSRKPLAAPKYTPTNFYCSSSAHNLSSVNS